MHSECIYTRRRLGRYLAGRLFALQRRRIERHLGRCQVCRSEFDALRQIEATRDLLGAIQPAEGLGRLRQTGAASLAAFLRLLHRPVWLVLIIASAAAAYQYVIHPLFHDPDLERLDVPAVTAPPSPRPLSAASVSTAAEQKKPAPPAAPKQVAAAPLVVTITVSEEKEASGIRRINEAMKEHALLRTMRFGRSVREISGSLTAGELRAFFQRIDGAGKVSYRRSRLASAGKSELIPFVMRLATAPAPPPPAPRPAPALAPPQPAVPKHDATPAEAPAPQPVSQAAPTAPQGQ